jgi:hypothetical protein
MQLGSRHSAQRYITMLCLDDSIADSLVLGATIVAGLQLMTCFVNTHCRRFLDQSDIMIQCQRSDLDGFRRILDTR